jgi:hypothetical protein
MAYRRIITACCWWSFDLCVGRCSFALGLLTSCADVDATAAAEELEVMTPPAAVGGVAASVRVRLRLQQLCEHGCGRVSIVCPMLPGRRVRERVIVPAPGMQCLLPSSRRCARLMSVRLSSVTPVERILLLCSRSLRFSSAPVLVQLLTSDPALLASPCIHLRLLLFSSSCCLHPPHDIRAILLRREVPARSAAVIR